MCSNCEKNSAAIRQVSPIQARAADVNKRLAVQAYNERQAQILQSKIHQQTALTKPTYR